MFSEPSTGGQGGCCLFCNLACPVGVEEFAPRCWRPSLNGRGESRRRGGVCARGLMLADLISQPARLYRAQGPAGDVTLDEAVGMLADRLRGAGARDGIELWLDGNVALEDLAAARVFCARRGGFARLRVHVPPHELGAVEGLDAAGVAQTPPEQWAEADAFVVIGDPLAGHPPVAPLLMRWGRARRETPMVVIDSVAGITSLYASQALICKPGYEFWVAAALLNDAGPEGLTGWLPDHASGQRQVSDSGVGLDSVHRAATQLRSARRPAVVVAPSAGTRSAWRAVAALVGKWASSRGGTITVLTSYANALGVSRYLRRQEVAEWTFGWDGDGMTPDVLWIVGWDPSSAYPGGAWEAVARRSGFVVFCGAFPPVQAEWFDMQVPLALGSEAGGTYVTAEGAARSVGGVLPPPEGVPTIRALLAMVDGRLGGGRASGSNVLDRPTVQEEQFAPSPVAYTVPPEPVRAESIELLSVALRSDATHYFDGQITRHARWAGIATPQPELHLSPADAKRFGVAEGGTAVVRNARGEVYVRVFVERNQPQFAGCGGEGSAGGGAVGGWGGITGALAEVRKLADWTADAAGEPADAGVLRVHVEPRTSARGVREGLHVHG